MNKLALVAAPIAILAAVACALPWYVGVQVERSIREEVSRFADSPWLPFSVALTHYDRGLFSSTAITRITLKAQPLSRLFDAILGPTGQPTRPQRPELQAAPARARSVALAQRTISQPLLPAAR